MTKRRPGTDIGELFARFERGDRGALSRLLTLAGRGELPIPPPTAKRASGSVVGVTGSGGVGKSSLLGAVAGRIAADGRTVGVLACDPESPVTGGALLGDRCRIAGGAGRERVFIRSLSTSSGSQGLARNLPVMLQLMRAFGFDRILVETVGAGQGDTAIREVVDLLVLVVQPQAGDELQWEKAGILELADLVVVNKADLPGAERTAAELTEQLDRPGQPVVPIVKTSVSRESGIEELIALLDAALDGNQPSP